MTARTIRDWRGLKTPLSRCSNDELVNMLAQSVITTERVRRFAGAVQAELTAREQMAGLNNFRSDALSA